jgi:hypothetical protein
MINTHEYIDRNKELSKLNTDIILTNIGTGIDTIAKLSAKIQISVDKTEDELMGYISSIKDISADIILENLNMMKAAMDRFTIPQEDTRVPRRTITKHGLNRPKQIYNCFRDKISKDNLPSQLTACYVEEDDDGTND